MAGWTLVLALSLFPPYCLLAPGARPAVAAPRPDIVSVFAGELRPGTRVTVVLMDNQKLKGEFLGVRGDRFVLRADRDRSGLLPISFPAIHSVTVRRGAAIVRP